MTRLQTNLEQSEQYSQEKSVRVKALHERAVLRGSCLTTIFDSKSLMSGQSISFD